MPVTHRYGRAAVDLSDIDDAVVLRVQASDGMLVGARLPAGAASQLGQQLQAAAAKAVARGYAANSDVQHLASHCYSCGAEIKAASGGDLYCPGCRRRGIKRRRVGHAQRPDDD